MLKELTEYKTFGSLRHLKVIAHAITRTTCSLDDLFIIAASESSAEIPRVKELVSLLNELGFCEIENNKVKSSEKLCAYMGGSLPIETVIAQELFKRTLSEGIMPLDAVKYDAENRLAYLNQHDILTCYSQIRNLLIESGVLKAENNKLIIDPISATILKESKKVLLNGLSPEQLLNKLERDRIIGEEAEKFVMEYEKRRIGYPLANEIQQVSLITVSAGYDIASFETPQSQRPDRFIEVKAVGNNGFFFSRNELDTAKKLGHKYFLYLVNVKRIGQNDYNPEIICNPSLVFSDTSDWRIVPDRFHVTKID